MELGIRRRRPGRLQWAAILFLSLSPLVGLAGLIYLVSSGTLARATWYLSGAIALAAGMGVTTGYHRLFSHRSYEASLPVRIWLLLTGTLGLQGSAIEWSIDHRAHHRFVDRDKDPYSIKKGFWFAHIFWIFRTRSRDQRPSHNADLWRDKFVFFQHRYFMPLALFMNFALPSLIAGLFWGDAAGGFFIAGVLRIVVTHQSTFLINSLCHYFGSQPYGNKHSARDNAITALFTWGEGYHNFHHEFAGDYRNGVRWFQFDPAKWTISLLAVLRLARNLKRVPEITIKLRRMQMQKSEMLMKIEKSGWPAASKEAFGARIDSTLAEFKSRATETLEGDVRSKDEPMRHASLKDAVKESVTEWQLLRRAARK